MLLSVIRFLVVTPCLPYILFFLIFSEFLLHFQNQKLFLLSLWHLLLVVMVAIPHPTAVMNVAKGETVIVGLVLANKNVLTTAALITWRSTGRSMVSLIGLTKLLL